MKKILVADGRDPLRLLVSKTLGGSDYRIVEARDGEEAFDVAHREHPDIIILDWMMRGKGGVEVVEALRADPQTCEIPIVMLSAKSPGAGRVDASALGVQGNLGKPFSPIELMETVEKILGGARCA
jgi:CheY-like chemotaxis protein